MLKLNVIECKTYPCTDNDRIHFQIRPFHESSVKWGFIVTGAVRFNITRAPKSQITMNWHGTETNYSRTYLASKSWKHMFISQRPIVDKKLILSLIELVLRSNFYVRICAIYLNAQKLKIWKVLWLSLTLAKNGPQA